jgi:DamX protein
MKQSHTSVSTLPHGGILAVAASAIALGAQLGILALVMPSAAPQAHAATKPAGVGALVMLPESQVGSELSIAASATPFPPSSLGSDRGTAIALESAPELDRILDSAAAQGRHPADVDRAIGVASEPIVDTELAMLALHTEVGSAEVPEPLQLPLLAALSEPQAEPRSEPNVEAEVATVVSDAAGPEAQTALATPALEEAESPAVDDSPVAGSVPSISQPTTEVATGLSPSAPELQPQDEETAGELSGPEPASATGIAWMQQAEPRDWTLQLVATRSLERIVALASKHALPSERTLVVQSERSGRPWYALVHGVFPDFESAAAAGSELGARLGEGEAWIRRIDEVRGAAVSLQATGVSTVDSVPERAATGPAGAGLRG